MINLIADKYTDAVDRLLKLQIARARESTKAIKFALAADAADSDAERKRLTAYVEGALAEVYETSSELATAARELIAIVGTLDDYGIPADPEILRMAHTAAANH